MRNIQEVTREIQKLARSADTDIAPIIQPTNPEGGYFGVPRVVLCYVNFLGLLYCGWDGEKDKKGLKKGFGESSQARTFIKEVFGKIDKLYSENGDILYDLFRHGTVHIYAPKKMIFEKDNKKTIEWLCYKGERESWQLFETRAYKWRHLQIVEWEKNRFILPLSINVLYLDLISSMELYNKLVHEDTTGNLLKRFASVMDAIDFDHDITPHTFWKNAIKFKKV